MLSRWYETMSLYRRAAHRDVPLISTSQPPQRLTELKNLRTLRELSGSRIPLYPARVALIASGHDSGM